MIRGDGPWAWTKRPVPVADSGGGSGRRPGDLVSDREAVGHHLSVVGRRQQVPTGPKVRRDAAERGQESLRVPDRLEAFHRPLALPGRLVRVLGAVVQVLRPAMLHRWHELAVGDLVAGELVGDDHPGYVSQALEQSAEELLCGQRVSARLDQNVEHVAVLVDRAPQVSLCAVDLNEHLIQVPFVARPRTTTAQLVRVLLPEPVAPGPDRLIGHVDTTFEHQLLHVAEAQREPVIQPDATADDLGRKPEPFIRRACSGHDRRSCPTSPSRITNLTVPLQTLNEPQLLKLYRRLLADGRVKPDNNSEMYAYWSDRVAKGEDPTPREVSEACKTTIHAARAAVRRYKSGIVPAKTTRGLAPKTVRNVHTLIHRALADAVAWKYIGSNPASNIKPPRRPRTRRDVWTPDQIQIFMKSVQQDRFAALFLLELTTGIRRGQLCGLKWPAVDLQAGDITVHDNRVVVGGRARDKAGGKTKNAD